jgi:hypothetical protein
MEIFCPDSMGIPPLYGLSLFRWMAKRSQQVVMIILCDAVTSDAQLILRQHTDVVRHLLFDADRLVSTSHDGTSRV